MGKGIAAGKYRGVARDIGQRDRAIADQRVFGGRHEVQGVVPHGRGLDQRMRLWRQGDDRQLGATMKNFLIGHFRVEELNIQCHLGVEAGERP
ncbi:hypothetical protein D3C80_1857070 [compost metagenome]